MQMRIGYELTYSCPNPTPMILALNVHYSRASDLVQPDHIITSPSVRVRGYRDATGNWISRITAPQGEITISTLAIINDSGLPDPESLFAHQHKVEDLPEETLQYLLGSRYCETDILTNIAWELFGNSPLGWVRVQTICDYVHNHIEFGYEHSRPTKTAAEAFREGKGVCRDYTHLAVAFCRCMNIPARYCTGYLSDIGTPAPRGPMDFSAWFEAYLDGQWWIFDPRNNKRRIGRVLIAQGRDAADVAISNTFGENQLTSFKVIADEITQ
jgi:transglutaminase-like putative cysteine protease